MEERYHKNPPQAGSINMLDTPGGLLEFGGENTAQLSVNQFKGIMVNMEYPW